MEKIMKYLGRLNGATKQDMKLIIEHTWTDRGYRLESYRWQITGEFYSDNLTKDKLEHVLLKKITEIIHRGDQLKKLMEES